MKPTLVVHTDYITPACYLAESVLDSLRQSGVAVERRPLELFPEPLPLPDFAAPDETAAWTDIIEPLAARHGMTLKRPKRAVRTRKAHEAVQFAATKQAGDALHRAIFRAYFADGLDIGRVDVLVRLGEAAGLDRSELKVALDLDTFAEAVVEHSAAAISAGVAAAPAFVAEQDGRRRALVGFHEAAEIRAWLGAHGRSRPGT
jgi:predicted DsbA family dithiol-disulfide isomerase